MQAIRFATARCDQTTQHVMFPAMPSSPAEVSQLRRQRTSYEEGPCLFSTEQIGRVAENNS